MRTSLFCSRDLRRKMQKAARSRSLSEATASKVQAWRLPSDASVSKVGVLAVLVSRWPQIGAVNLH